MASAFLRFQWCSFFLPLFFVLGCSLNLELKKSWGEKEFFQETSRLEKLAREDPKTSVRAKSHLKLAFLFVNSRNPQLNYSRALQEMESYLSILPAKAQNGDFQNWLAVLREMDYLSKCGMEIEKKNQSLRVRSDKLQASMEKVQKTNIHLRDEVVTLKEINNKIIETIDRLKILDYQMEEKRSLIR